MGGSLQDKEQDLAIKHTWANGREQHISNLDQALWATRAHLNNWLGVFNVLELRPLPSDHRPRFTDNLSSGRDS